MVMIDMKVELRKLLTETTARFQRTHDGQFVGRVVFNGEEIECWLVFDDYGPGVKDQALRKASGVPMAGPAFLRSSFENPYTQIMEVGGQ